MNVTVIINGKAGNADIKTIEKAIQSALFRCKLRFLAPRSPEELQGQIVIEAKNADALVICGGDGTLNTCVQPLLKAREHLDRLPPICPLPVGTANDLARELGVSDRLERAARLVLEGEIKSMDLLKVTAEGQSAYMLTNGGLGIPAITAEIVNDFRDRVKRRTDQEQGDWYLPKAIYELGRFAIQRGGSHIYEVMLARELMRWDSESWSVEIDFPDKDTLVTSAPFIMINNQRLLGGHFAAAPLTSHSDGTFNVLLLPATTISKQLRVLMQIRRGLIPSEEDCPRFETNRCVIRRQSQSRPLTFFGDGEVLHRNVSEVQIDCLHGELPVFVQKELS